MRKLLVVLAVLAGVAALSGGFSSSAKGYGGDGHMGVYQVGVSFNCDNRTLCVDPTTGQPSLGGFWGWLELDNAAADGQSGVGGDGQFAGCGHGGEFTGAGHTSYDIATWWIAPDPSNGGLPTFYISGTETDSFRGQTDSFAFSGSTGIPAFTVHRPILKLFGQPTLPGMSINVQVSYKPAR
jgi:hypothetical protein